MDMSKTLALLDAFNEFCEIFIGFNTFNVLILAAK
jgi:hypothetical protein